MIEIGSFIGLAAVTKSELTIKNCAYDQLGQILYTFAKLGIKTIRQNDDIFIPRHDEYEIELNMDGSILTIYDAPYPDLPRLN